MLDPMMQDARTPATQDSRNRGSSFSSLIPQLRNQLAQFGHPKSGLEKQAKQPGVEAAGSFASVPRRLLFAIDRL
jgi:hypothetical protein